MTILPEIVLSSGDRVSVRVVSGTVTDDQQSSDTRFHSVGGGGYVGPHGGRVDAPQMRSSTAKQQLIWITDSTGHDTSITLKNVSIPLRVGQQVTAFFCKVGNSVERCDYFSNQSARLHYHLARELAPPVDFKQRYRTGFVLKALLLLSIALLLLALGMSERLAEQRDAVYKVGGECLSIRPKGKTLFAEQEAKGRWYRCTQREESIKEDLLAWHWRLGYLGAVFLLLVIVRFVLKQSFADRLHQEYLSKLEAALLHVG